MIREPTVPFSPISRQCLYEHLRFEVKIKKILHTVFTPVDRGFLTILSKYINIILCYQYKKILNEDEKTLNLYLNTVY